MPLNDEQAIKDLIALSDKLESMCKDKKTIEEVKRYDAEQTVKIWREYVTSGDVDTTVTGTGYQGAPVTGTGKGKIT